MKYIDFHSLQAGHKRKIADGNPENTTTAPGKEKSAVVIPLHSMLKNELKLYRGSSKSIRLGVLRKYDELIAMARKK